MQDLRIIDFPPAPVIKTGQRTIRILIRRLANAGGWSLKIVAYNGSLTFWDETFASEQAALDEALKTIEEDGIASFFMVSGPLMN